MQITIGVFHEKTSRKLTAHTSYAADHVEHETKAGDYPLRLVLVGGYMVPMPYWLCVKLDTEVVSGGYYSGFCGNNFAFSPAPLGPSAYGLQLYSYHLKQLVDDGTVTLAPEWAWMAEVKTQWEGIEERGLTWEKLAAMGGEWK